MIQGGAKLPYFNTTHFQMCGIFLTNKFLKITERLVNYEQNDILLGQWRRGSQKLQTLFRYRQKI